jgi:hypothetical protein
LQVGRHGTAVQLSEPPDERWLIKFFQCTECNRIAIYLSKGFGTLRGGMQDHLLWPRVAVGEPLSPHVPPDIVADYEEARIVMATSAKASAALSRRLLQRILREKAGMTERDLAAQIESVLPTLPSYIQKSVDGIRNAGAFAAHPLKGQSPGEIADVEPGEAEWSLDTLRDVIDLYYVRPQIEAERIANMNQKLAASGKPPMKRVDAV